MADEVIGRHFSLFYFPEDQEKGGPEWNAGGFGGSKSSGWIVRKDGNWVWASTALDPVYEGGKLVGFVQATRDASQKDEAEEQIAQAIRNLEIALTYMNQGLVLYDSAGRLILANRRLSEMFSIPAAVLQPGMDMVEAMEALGFSCSRAKLMHRRLNLPRTSHPSDRSLEETKSGQIISLATQRVPEGGWVTTFEDVTECQKAKLKLEHLRHHDPLTGLANRTLFRQRLEEALARMKRGLPFALLLLDIKSFSSVNDSLGEEAGDELLRSIAERIKKRVREVDTVARLDGDVFAILQCNPGAPGDAEILASRLLGCFRLPFQISGQSVIASVSVGIAMGASDGTEAEEVLKNAHLALGRAKQSLLPRYSFFNSEIDTHLKTRRALKDDLYEASERGDFTLHYQPITDIRTDNIVGFEVLLRWWHPSRGWVSPAEFVPVAEECGLIVSIGEWVLRTACAEAARWLSACHVAVNLSALQFQDGRLPATIAQALAMSGLEPQRLELEITESVLLKDDETNLAILSELRELGVRISLDDFGIGYSSLSYLRSFRFDKLKIDRSFVRDLPQSDAAKKIVKAIIGLGRSFGISIVAEGVETQEQLEYLQQQGCDEVQGYLLGRPQPADELWDTRLLETNESDVLAQDAAVLPAEPEPLLAAAYPEALPEVTAELGQDTGRVSQLRHETAALIRQKPMHTARAVLAWMREEPL